MFHQQANVTSPEGRAKLAKKAIWPNGPLWSEITGDALPELPDVHNNCGEYDLYFTDFHPQFWTWAARGFDDHALVVSPKLWCLNTVKRMHREVSNSAHQA